MGHGTPSEVLWKTAWTITAWPLQSTEKVWLLQDLPLRACGFGKGLPDSVPSPVKQEEGGRANLQAHVK
jgi:hypothetical protein